MNWLAHALLAKSDIECRLGNVLADHVRGRDRLAMSESFRRGLREHQIIDAFTDFHAAVHRSKARLGDEYGHFTGIYIDIFYDHFLTLDWDRFSPVRLQTFTSRLYEEARSHPIELPSEARFALDQMILEDRLGSYGTIDGMEAALRRVSNRVLARTGKEFNLEKGIVALTDNFDGLRLDFLEFFPMLQQHVAESTSNPP